MPDVLDNWDNTGSSGQLQLKTWEDQDGFTHVQITTLGISSSSALALLEQHCWILDAVADSDSLCHVTVLCLDKKTPRTSGYNGWPNAILPHAAASLSPGSQDQRCPNQVSMELFQVWPI